MAARRSVRDAIHGLNAGLVMNASISEVENG